MVFLLIILSNKLIFNYMENFIKEDTHDSRSIFKWL